MLPKLGMKERNGNSRNLKGVVVVGLGILVHRSPEPNLVVKQSRKLTYSSVAANSNNNNNPRFLKSCSLCKRNLNPQEDIYMYRGDQGYCSIKCRNQQIEFDEKRELEASTSKILASFRNCHKNNNEPIETQTPFLRRHTRIPPVVS